jgi:hypothetical protein
MVVEAPDDPDLHVTMNPQDTVIVPGTMAEVEDPDHRDGHMITHARETQKIQSRKHGLIGPVTSGMSTIKRMNKLRLGLPALPVGFA